MMIVVVDTNVWISALVFGRGSGIPFQALSRAASHDTMATCTEIETELTDTLRYGFDWPDFRIEKAMQETLFRSIRVTISNTVHLCRDPGDDKFLECAERARADLLITGDKDLLTLRTHGRTRILTPAAYLKL
jgi:putative PIN family toxin of toxin-antitoxin system